VTGSPDSSPLWPQVWGLALPVLAEEGLNLLVGYTDRFLAGWFIPGPDAQAAMGLMAYTLWLVPTLFAVISIGATALVARLVGSGDFVIAGRASGQALLLGGGVAIVVTLGLWLAGAPFVATMGLEGEASRLAARYLAWLTPVVPIMMLEQIGSAALRGAGDTVSGLVARGVVNVVHVVVGTTLVAGLGGAPKLGIAGLAIGAACGHGVGGLIILARLLHGQRGLKLHRADLQFDREIVRRLLRIGVPGGLDALSVVFCHLVYLRIITSLGTLATGAHSLGLQIEALSYLSGSAFQVAAATIAGQSLGARDERRATRGILACCLAACGLMTCAAILFYVEGSTIAAAFTGGVQDATSELAGRLLKIVALGGPPLALLIVLSGALRGAGDTAWPLAITFIGLVGIRIPLAIWLAWDRVPLIGDWEIAGMGYGVEGAWWAMVVDVAVRAALMTSRFWQGGWKHTAV
jgi:putative MATE family efflux protein